MSNKTGYSKQILFTVALAFTAAVCGGFFTLWAGGNDAPFSTEPVAEAAPATEGTATENAAGAAKRILPSVVGVRADGAALGGVATMFESNGSGVIIDERGYIVTNHHVIADGDDITVTFADDSEVAATVVGSDPRTDLALLKAEKDDLVAAAVNEEAVKIGETVYAVGNPGGQEFAGTVTRGIISGLDRTLITDDGASFSLLQTDAAINPGNSGGALCNEKGEVIGINAIKISEAGFEGMGFAIPAGTVMEIIAELLENGAVRRGALGVYLLATVDKSFAAEYNTGIDHGVVIAPQEGGAAEAAGLLDYDIITAVNDVAVTDIAALQREIFGLDAGDIVTVTVWRDGNEGRYTIVLEELKEG